MANWRKAKPFQCPKCTKDFDKESQLRKHFKDAHGLDYRGYFQETQMQQPVKESVVSNERA